MPADLPPEDRTLPAMLRRQAARHGDRPLFRCGDTAWTYAETVGVAARAAGRLDAAGIVPGERVALFSTNSAAMMECVLGCLWHGAIAVPVHAGARGPSLQHVLADSGARLLVAAPDLLPALDTIDRGATAIAATWTFGALPPPGADIDPAPSRPGDTALILYTSGTTGPAKGVCCPQAQYYWWGVNTARQLGIVEGDVLGTALPLFHTNALNTFFQALLHGASMVLLPRFSASRYWHAMAASGATVSYLLGAMVPMLLAQPEGPHERAHRVRVALGPGVPADLHAPFRDRTGVELLEGFGSTETNFTHGAGAGRQRPGWMGPVAPGFAAQVVDAQDNAVPDGTAGELVLRGEQPFAFATGYWNAPDRTVEAWRNLWFHTGDRVLRDADGWYRFIDRQKDAIRRRGENISSFEVEQVILAHPAVAAAAAFPVRSELAEDEVMVAVIRRPGAALDGAALCAFAAGLLARHAVPRYVDFVDALPLTANGKVQKFRLIARGVTDTTWDRGPR